MKRGFKRFVISLLIACAVIFGVSVFRWIFDVMGISIVIYKEDYVIICALLTATFYILMEDD